MAQRPDRLERLVEGELGECRAADVEARLETLEAFAADVPDAVDRDVNALKALGNDTRYTVIRLLRAADRELCVCEITPVVDVSDSAISHALSTLHDAGLVRRRKDGTWRYYETTDRAEVLLDALDETRDGGEGR
ncbi:transcriptional regulator [Halobacteriales archaeon QS_5_70_15]|jgi:DNA-binding transcriptional ArsR family regulator|nr:MAG: transcriptional regulator [Halobacteriales archaeon QS_5_70_15]